MCYVHTKCSDENSKPCSNMCILYGFDKCTYVGIYTYVYSY